MQRLKAEISRLYKPKNPIKTTCSTLAIAVCAAAAIGVLDKGVSFLIGLFL